MTCVTRALAAVAGIVLAAPLVGRLGGDERADGDDARGRRLRDPASRRPRHLSPGKHDRRRGREAGARRRLLLLPSTAREDVAQIRRWTSKPVAWLVNTHWHFDHTLGNAVYADAFPGIQIVAQAATRKTIADFNPGAVARYPGRAERFRKVLDSGKNPDGTPLSAAERKDYERSLVGLDSGRRRDEGRGAARAERRFDRELTIDLGNRPVRIRFLGRGNTAGDTIVYLPDEKILATGDLVDHPVPYFFGGFPVDEVATLRALAEIDARLIVPGHGDVLKDKSYLLQMIALLEAVNSGIEREINAGKTLAEVQDSFPKALDVKTWKERFAGANAEDGDFFDETFAGLVKASYEQLHAR